MNKKSPRYEAIFVVQRVLKIDGPMGRRFLGLTIAARLRVKDCPAGNEYKYRLLAVAVGRPSLFQGAHHRCEAAYKNYGKAATTTL